MLGYCRSKWAYASVSHYFPGTIQYVFATFPDLVYPPAQLEVLKAAEGATFTSDKEAYVKMMHELAKYESQCLLSDFA